MRIIGVLDILNGQVVRAVAGQRQHYRPLVSCWTRSTNPLDVIQALSETFGLREFYVADLDSILFRRPNWKTLESLQHLGLRIWLDGGFHDWQDVFQTVRELDVFPVVGLETWKLSPGAENASFSRSASALHRPAMFSLDARGGTWLAPDACSHQKTPADLASWAWQQGFDHLLALDLAAVGTGQLHWTTRLLEAARPGAPQALWYAGGGVASPDDLERLKQMGIAGVLVASALHDGRILPHQVRDLVQAYVAL